MKVTDFEYDGLKLSEFSVSNPQMDTFITCEFEGDDGLSTVSIGSQITFNKNSQSNGKKYYNSGYHYDDCITATFDICKNPETWNNESATYSTKQIYYKEYQQLVRWLNRKEFKPFRLIYAQSDREADLNLPTAVYFNASFNIEKIEINGVLYGLRLTMETDMPYGYGETVSTSISLNGATSTSKNVKDSSDESGLTNTIVSIQYMGSNVPEENSVSIRNNSTDEEIIITNGKSGEVVSIDSQTQIIQTSSSSHDLPSNYNFSYLHLTNATNVETQGFVDANNIIVVTATSGTVESVTINYVPIIKDSI